MDKLPIGTILTSRNDDYEKDWGNTDFYAVLEYYRPKNMLSHKESVFMVDNDDDLDLAGGGTDWVFTVVPMGIVQKHDLNWSSEISMLISDGHDINDENVKKSALNYWNGVPHPNESVWEYLTTKAKIVKVDEF
jgi:hypothetical protein